ncbi:hypothetical protein CRE_00323 [Caenorhabditis remanei]|uniref:Uncharacterized protein n=1 Tax=Caenorhabditis remanei TaxID=31234 RepID=E3LEI3_CAERE|nr:hypothetical protein CRE_00323 [Caenorhabditis remanei]
MDWRSMFATKKHLTLFLFSQFEIESSTAIKYHIPPMIIFVVVVISCLIIGFLVDYIMQKHGCCGRRGGCCRPEQERPDGGGDGLGAIPLASINTQNNQLPRRLPLLPSAPQQDTRV